MKYDCNYSEFKSGFYNAQTDIILAIYMNNLYSLRKQLDSTSIGRGYNDAYNYYYERTHFSKNKLLRAMTDKSILINMMEMFYNNAKSSFKEIDIMLEDEDYCRWHEGFCAGRFNICLQVSFGNLRRIKPIREDGYLIKGYNDAISIYTKSSNIINMIMTHRNIKDIDYEIYQEKCLEKKAILY